MRTVATGIVTYLFNSIVRTALYGEGQGGYLRRGQRRWLLYRTGYEPRASLTLGDSAEQSFRERARVVLQQEQHKL